MNKANTLLKNAREDKGFQLSEMAKKLKTPLKYLEALENGDVRSLPQEPYCSLLVRDYADLLGLNGQNILVLFRRDFYQEKNYKPGRRIFFGFTPQITFTFVIILTLSLISAYLFGEYLKFNRPPPLKIIWPETPATTLEIRGRTDPESTIRINQDLVVVDPQGDFSHSLSLTPPETKIVIEAKSPAGKTTVEEKIYRLP